MDNILKFIDDNFAESGIKMLEIILMIFFGSIFIKLILLFLKKIFLNFKLDNSIIGFIMSFIKISLCIILLLIILSLLNVPLTSMVTIISAAAVGIGLAIQDSLSNVANGIILVGVKPFKVGDHVQIGSYSGYIREIKMIHTELITFDNRKIIIPNKVVFNSEIINYSSFKIRRVEVSIPLNFNANIEQAKTIIEGVVNKNPLILKSQEFFCKITGLNDSSLNLMIRVWCNTDDYWKLYYELTEIIFNELRANNIKLPYKTITLDEVKYGRD